MTQRYTYQHGTIWRQSEGRQGPIITSVEPEAALRLLALHEADDCTADEAAELRTALIELQNESVDG